MTDYHSLVKEFAAKAEGRRRNWKLRYLERSLRSGELREPTCGRIVARHGKAALETHPIQTLRAGQKPLNFAKRLECVRFIGAFSLASHGQLLMVPRRSRKRRRTRKRWAVRLFARRLAAWPITGCPLEAAR